MTRQSNDFKTASGFPNAPESLSVRIRILLFKNLFLWTQSTHKSWLNASLKWLLWLGHENWQQPWNQSGDYSNATLNVVKDHCKEPPIEILCYWHLSRRDRGVIKWRNEEEAEGLEERWREKGLGWKPDKLSLKQQWQIHADCWNNRPPPNCQEVWGDEENKHTHLNAWQRGNKMHFEQQRKTFTVVFDVTVSTCCFCSAPPILEIL